MNLPWNPLSSPPGKNLQPSKSVNHAGNKDSIAVTAGLSTLTNIMDRFLRKICSSLKRKNPVAAVAMLSQPERKRFQT